MAFAPRSPGCYEHHMVWFDGEPLIRIGCAHCSYVATQLDLSATYTDDDVQAAIESSRRSHARLCDRDRRQQSRRTPNRRR